MLLTKASRLAEVDAAMAGALTPAIIERDRRADSRRVARGRARRSARRTAAISSTGWRRRARSSRRRSVPAEHTYDYAIIRVVPRVERGELINVGVILSCPSADFLEARIELDAARLLRARSGARRRGDRAPTSRSSRASAAAARRPGAIGELPQRSRFHWLVSPRSTIIQMSPVHTGRTDDPAKALRASARDDGAVTGRRLGDARPSGPSRWALG